MGAFSEADIEQLEDSEELVEGTAGHSTQEVFKSKLDSSSAWSSDPLSQGGQAGTVSPAQNETSDTADEQQEETTQTETPSEQESRKVHEEAEARRKEEWEAKQAAKKAAIEKQLQEIAGMSEDELIQASAKRITDETERLTRRNMKEYVAEHLQTLCLDDLEFAKLTMHPRKSFMHCIWYINRKAREYLEKEMEDNGMQRPFGVNGMYGGDVPDDLVYSWAEEYYRTPDAKEDEDPDEKFQPKAYTGPGSTKTSGNGKAKQKKTEKPTPQRREKAEDDSQISLGAFLQNEKRAG